MYLSSNNCLTNKFSPDMINNYRCYMIEVTKSLAIDFRAREWCKIPYEGHPNGCPNWNRNPHCPPNVPIITDVFDLTKPLWFSIVEFNLLQHRTNMAIKHPNWSEKQCNCCLYWQNGVRKQLKMQCRNALRDNLGSIYTLIPEAMGINVFKTARNIGIILKRNPRDIIIKIALIGSHNSDMVIPNSHVHT